MQTILLAKYTEGKPLELCEVNTMQGEYVTRLREAGYLDFVAGERPQVEAGQTAVDSFTIADGKVVQHWEVKTDPEALQARIDELKQQLTESDYKVIKCYECSLLDEALPYDIDSLHAERQAIRDEINRLESVLAESYA